ncbi:MAG TPA: phosphotransferase [Candidatus Saccharimonadales bacterium]|nr:phosphotransferase [Candidatus Saccharimonadales bacterium]
MEPQQTPEIKFAHTAFRAYGLAENAVITSIPTARSRTVLRAEASKDVAYIIRVSDSSTNHLLENEVHITTQLSKTNLQSAAIIPFSNKGMFYNEANRTVVVTRFIPGQHPVAGKVSIATARRLGTALAQFHSSVTSLPYSNADQLLSQSPTDWIKSELKIAKLADLEELKHVAHSFNDNDLPVGIIHGDFHTNNILIEGDKIALLDFEYSGEGVLLLDITRSALDICRSGNLFSEAKLKAYIAGYESIRPLTHAEWDMLGAAFAYATLVVANWFNKHGLVTECNQFISRGIVAMGLVESVRCMELMEV